MKIIRGREIMDSPVTATIGTFDGVHLGHGKIINKATAAARAAGQPSTLITFDRHPKEVICPGIKLNALTTIKTKLRLLGDFDLDYIVLLEFDSKLAAQPPGDFCMRVLIDRLKVSRLFVGENFRFGAGAAGDPDFLNSFGSENGFAVDVVTLLKINDTTVSSTVIRELLMDGKVGDIPALLGRFHFLTGIVVKGAGRGAEIGFPTANLDVDSDLCMPKEGVYAGYLWLREKPLAAAINVGSNPTFGPGTVHLEAFIFDFSEDIYGERVRVELQHFIRPEAKYPSLETLVKQIGKDIDAARLWLKNAKPTGMLGDSSLSSE